MRNANIQPYVKTRIHRIYKSMKARCYGSKKCPYFKNYGGRGIKVCDEWLNNELSFIEWAFSHGYTDELTIDRIDVNGDYTPENCRWATCKEQNNNRRTNHYIEIDGVKRTIKEWGTVVGISSEVISYRLHHGWDEKEAIFTPVMTFSEASFKGRAKVKARGLKEDYLLDYLREHKEGINKHEALELLQIVNLPSVIHILRRKGHDIKSTKHGSYTVYQL